MVCLKFTWENLYKKRGCLKSPIDCQRACRIEAKKFKLFGNDNKNYLFAALLRKMVATKAQRHELKKMHSIFLLCLGDFVAKFNFCKKLFHPFIILVISSLSKPMWSLECNPPSASSG